MVSEEFRQVEGKIGAALILHADLVGELAYKLKRERDEIEHALLIACAATGTRPLDTAFCVNEFLAALHEGVLPRNEESKA